MPSGLIFILLMLQMFDFMLRVTRQNDSDAIDGGLADEGDGERAYGQINAALAATIMYNL